MSSCAAAPFRQAMATSVTIARRVRARDFHIIVSVTLRVDRSGDRVTFGPSYGDATRHRGRIENGDDSGTRLARHVRGRDDEWKREGKDRRKTSAASAARRERNETRARKMSSIWNGPLRHTRPARNTWIPPSSFRAYRRDGGRGDRPAPPQPPRARHPARVAPREPPAHFRGGRRGAQTQAHGRASPGHPATFEGVRAGGGAKAVQGRDSRVNRKD